MRANQFGTKIKSARLKIGLLQQDIASQLHIDPPMLSKIESGERSARREHVNALSKIFKLPEEDLLSLWLADKVLEVIIDEPLAKKTLKLAYNGLNNIKKNK